MFSTGATLYLKFNVTEKTLAVGLNVGEYVVIGENINVKIMPAVGFERGDIGIKWNYVSTPEKYIPVRRILFSSLRYLLHAFF